MPGISAKASGLMLPNPIIRAGIEDSGNPLEIAASPILEGSSLVILAEKIAVSESGE
jgi:hypothetical protein